MTKVVYENEREVFLSEPGLTILELSLRNGIPHCHACGGNARCSTCRIIVLDGIEQLGPRNEKEAALARQKGFESHIRLACQTKVNGPTKIRRLVIDDEDIEVALGDSNRTTGKEMKLAVMFSDIRNFTPFSESLLPYDVIHILNRYFRKIGEEILRNDGYIDKYMGDGIMALFGLESEDKVTACEDAVLAGLDMSEALDDLNIYLKKQFNTNFDIGIGIHVGPVIVGEMGHPNRRQFSAIGDVVNTASRIESATKQFKARLLVSAAVYDLVKSRITESTRYEAELKGKSGTHILYEIKQVDPQWRASRRSGKEAAQLFWALHQAVPRNEAPRMLRLAFHDACSFNPQTGEGGANGSIRFHEELNMPAHAGLAQAVVRLGNVKEHFPKVSWADLIAVAGAAAVKKCGGPEIMMALGRKDARKPTQDHGVPSEHLDASNLVRHFSRQGFTKRDLVALSGAHTLGSAHGKPFTPDLFTFNNSYYKLLLKHQKDPDPHFLPSDKALLDDPEMAQIVNEYAIDQEHFFRDFAAAYIKMTWLGTKMGGTRIERKP